jgi:multidrug efflux pump
LRAIGTGVIGGIVASSVVAIVFTPLFFWLLESMSARFGQGKRRKATKHGGGALTPSPARQEEA